MPTEDQLDTWSHQGAVVTSQKTHEAIRNALDAHAPLKDKDLEVYLQGSYKNDTNIRADSDVDVVVQLNQVFFRNLNALSAEEITLYKQNYSESTYKYNNFRADVIQALNSYFDASNITEGNKSVKVASGSNRLSADVIICLQHRKYKSFKSLSNQTFVEGIEFSARAISIVWRTNTSSSRSLVASIITQSEPNVLTYQYLNEPNQNAPETMHMHRGTTIADIEKDQTLSGGCYSNRDRKTNGKFSLKKIE